MAEKPQETIRELRELVVAYAKQETLDPLKGLGRFVAFGLAGAILLGTGVVFVEIGALRLLEGWGPRRAHHFRGGWSWVPYAIVVGGSFVVAGLSFVAGTRQNRKRRRRRGRA